MKTNYILGLLLMLAFFSCREEEIFIEDETTTTSPPIDLDGAFFSGQILDNNGLGVEAAVVKVYQSNSLIGEVISNQDGQYNTENLSLEIGPQVTFAVEEEGFLNQYRRSESIDQIYQDYNLRLATSDQGLGLQNRVLENPGSDSLIKVFGTITDKDGVPIPNAFSSVVHDLMPELSSISFQGGYDKTDENGYMEVLVPKGENIFFFSSLDARESTAECQNVFNVADTSFLFGLLSMDNLGILSFDTEVVERENISLDKTTYQISGILLNCDGSPVTTGSVEVDLVYFVNGIRNRTTVQTNEFSDQGEYILEKELCHYGDIQAEITISGDDVYTSELDTIFPIGGDMLPVLTTCSSTSTITSTMNLNIGTDHTFENIVFKRPPSTVQNEYFGVGFHQGIINSVLFAAPTLEIGMNAIDLEINSPLQIQAFGFGTLTSDDEVFLNVEEITEKTITGTLSGEVMTNELGIQEISGDVTINIK